MLNQPQKLTVVGTQHCSLLSDPAQHQQPDQKIKAHGPVQKKNNMAWSESKQLQPEKKVLGTQGVEITHPFLESIRHSPPMKQSYLPIAVTPQPVLT